MDPIVFGEKMRRPDLGGLSRERLEQRLSGPGSPSVGLVLGPAGSGKTTLLSRVAAAGTLPSAWYRAAIEDEDESSLVSHLGQALGSILGSAGVTAAAVSGRVDTLLRALEQAPSRGVQVVIDDLHELCGTRAEMALERFVDLRPRRVRILLGSRRPPHLNTSRLLVSGELGQLDAEDLRFRSWEVEELFRVVYRQPLSPEAAAALTRRTGGWAAGLQLFQLATAGLTRLERERAVDELSGRSRLIRSYLARNVLDVLDGSRRSFLIKTCTLGVLTGALCDRLLDTTGSAAVLAELEQQQFFTSSSDGGATFRYHQVLQTHLEVLLVDELGPDTARRLYGRSAELLEAAGLWTPALRAHAQAEDWGAVGRLLQQTSSTMPADQPWALMRVPGLAPDDPGLVVANARRMLRSGRVAEAVAGFRLAESLLDDPDFQSRCARERATAAEWLPDAPVPDRQQAVPQDRGVRLSRELRELTRTVREPRRATTALARGIGLLLSGQLAAAAAELRHAVDEPAAASWETLAVGLAGQVAELVGFSDSAAGQLEQVVLGADVEGLPWLSRIARGLEAAAFFVRQPTPWRLRSGADLVEECDRRGDRWGCCLLALALGAACLTSEPDRGEADRLLGVAEQAAGELGAPVLQVWARALLAYGKGPAPVDDVRSAASRLGVELPPALRSTGPRPAAPVTPQPSVPRVRLICLGSFDLVVDGVSMSWQNLRPRARALLMLLALHHGHGVHRETLVAQLWPDASLTSGVRSLQVAVSSLRQCLAAAGLPEDCLQRKGDAYGLRLPGAEVELAEFEELLRRGGRAEAAGDVRQAMQAQLAALDLYSGDLLPEVGPAEWVVQERDRLRDAAARAGADASRGALRLGELATGIRAVRRSLELDPYHDQSWQLLIELFERAGDHTAAAVTRRDHERVCADLGL
jgi:DNA-binding SARP family transcriptional activator